jgi:hypothetical protein
MIFFFKSIDLITQFNQFFDSIIANPVPKQTLSITIEIPHAYLFRGWSYKL